MFKIEINNPTVFSIEIEDDASLEESIENMFPLENESLVIIWNNISIPLTYKYDVSCMVLDFVRLLSFIENNAETDLEIHWTPNTFASVWKIQKVNSFIKIESKWNSVIGGLEELLNKLSQNIIEQQDLKIEIKKVLGFLKNTIQQTAINYEKIDDFGVLEKNL